MRNRLGFNRKVAFPERWPWYAPAFIAFFISLGVVALMAIALQEMRTDRVRELQRDLDLSTREVEFRLMSARKFLDALAHDFSGSDAASAEFAKRANRFLSDRPELTAIFYADPKGKVSLIAPGDEHSLDALWTIESMAYVFQEMIGTRTKRSEKFLSFKSRRALAIFSPSFRDGVYKGAFAAKFYYEDLLQAAIDPSLHNDYAIVLDGADGEIESAIFQRDRTESDISQSRPITLDGIDLRLTLTAYQTPFRWPFILLGAACFGLALGLSAALFILSRRVFRRERIEAALRRAKESAESANKAKTEFVANISHEIRTPLGAIQGYAELLGDYNGEASNFESYVASIRRNCRILLDLVNDLLDLSKVEAGLLELEQQPVHIAEMVHEQVALLEPLALQKNINIRIEFQPDVPSSFETDDKRIRQILTNLLSNAIKFTQHGEIVLTVTRKQKSRDKEGFLIFDVKDTGVGISSEQRQQLFQPFRQGDSSIARRFGGTGLGLVLARKLAFVLKGDLILRESTPGVGSTFRFIIPLTRPSAATVVEVPRVMGKTVQPTLNLSQPKRQRLKDWKILLVEDCEDNQLIYERFLEVEGAKVSIAANGAEAIDIVDQTDFDLIFMDVQMPEVDGYEATSTIRKCGYRRPIIALTAHAMKGERERCFKAGCNEYLTKPVDADTLVRRALSVASVVSRQEGFALPLARPNTEQQIFDGARTAAQEFELEQKLFSSSDNPTEKCIITANEPKNTLGIHSRYHTDPVVRPLLDIFVGGLSRRFDEMSAAIEAKDKGRVAALAHKLKGTAANYGYPDLSEVAAALETEVKGESEEIASFELMIQRMKELNKRMRQGLDIPLELSQDETQREVRGIPG
jgi:signal transduction histidine kinase/DNA-binding response OmpR family regulator/HPt (histidine-containing phosphotransfer) domain-containing protein